MAGLKTQFKAAFTGLSVEEMRLCLLDLEWETNQCDEQPKEHLRDLIMYGHAGWETLKSDELLEEAWGWFGDAGEPETVHCATEFILEWKGGRNPR